MLDSPTVTTENNVMSSNGPRFNESSALSATKRRPSDPVWVKVVASVAAAAAFISLTIIAAVSMKKCYRRNRIETISLEHILYDASDSTSL